MVRLSGTNSELGNKKLQEFNKSKKLNITVATDLGDAAKKAADIAKAQTQKKKWLIFKNNCKKYIRKFNNFN